MGSLLKNCYLITIFRNIPCAKMICVPQNWMDESGGSDDSILKHKSIWARYDSRHGKKKKKKIKKNEKKKRGDLRRTYGTRIIPV